MPGAGGLRTSAARHRHHGRVPCRHITGALAGRRCNPRRRSLLALSLLICFARRCRQPELPGSASAVVVLIAAATLAAIPMPCMALALGPLGAGKGGFQLPRRGHTQLAALQAGPHPPMAPAQPHRLDTPLRGGVGEVQLPHRVVEQAREPAPPRQTAPVDLIEMVQDVHIDAALIGGQTPGLLEELLVAELSALPGVAAARYCGSLRRLRPTIADLDILVAAADPGPVMAHAAALPVVDASRPPHGGDTRAALTTRRGMHVDLRVVVPDQYGAAALYFTGSQAHNIRLRGLAAARGWLLNEYGLWNEHRELIAAATEEAIYAALGLPPIPPPLREDRGEIEAAQRNELPTPVTMADLRGDLHLHTDASGDGRSTLEEMVAAAAGRGLSYLAITDHGEDMGMNGVSRERLLAQRAALRALDAAYPRLRLLHGVELNIGPDGSLDYDAAFRASFDWCVAAVHSAFDLDRAAQTRRIIAAMEDPAVNAIGHLSGRMIGRRPGIELDIDAILASAARTGTAIEINGSLNRLDASADVLRRARALDVTIVVNSDAHHQREFERLHWGALHAQRGWVDRERIANTWPAKRFLAWAAHQRGATP